MTISDREADGQRSLGSRHAQRRPLKGRTVLIWLASFFAVVIGVNALMAKLAIDTLPGTDVDSAYQAGKSSSSSKTVIDPYAKALADAAKRKAAEEAARKAAEAAKKKAQNADIRKQADTMGRGKAVISHGKKAVL